MAALNFVPAGLGMAQTFTNLHSFTALSAFPYTNSDGANPSGGLILSGNTLYGTAESGGIGGQGAMFAVHADGTGGFTNLHSFTALPYPFTNYDGANPSAALILTGNTLYGTAQAGGGSDNGTVFGVSADGTDFTNLHSFTFASQDFSSTTYISYTNSDGASPVAGLVISGNILYGVAQLGGSAGRGTVFAVHADGTGGYTNLHSFTAISGALATNSDGADPAAGLVLSGNTLYGTAKSGGDSGNGTVFRINADGTGGFTNLYNFTATSSSFPHPNSDGANPSAALALSGNTLYGTAHNGGAWGKGTVFAIQTDGMSFTNLHDFSGSPGDGSLPSAALILSGDTLYGTTLGGGTSDAGTVFAIKTNGMNFTILYSFTANPGSAHTNSDGATPTGLILSGNTLYGTTAAGGGSAEGTVFSLTLPAPPQLSITRSGIKVILRWPANATGFTLQSATNLPSSVWTTNSPAPVVIAGQNTVTNPISGKQKFYRLSQ